LKLAKPVLRGRPDSFSYVASLDASLERPQCEPTYHPALLFTCAVIVYWVGIMYALSPAQFADSIEQYNWAHSLEWGYWKHPPLSTWLMHAAISVMGPQPWVSYALAACCLCGTAFLTWRVALMLLPPQTAALALIFWPLHHGLSWRAHVYNHNTVLLLASSAMVWSALRAARRNRTQDWAIAGALTGLGLLAKYQAAVPLLAILFALWHTGVLRGREQAHKFLVASITAFAVLLPHALWALHRGIPTLGYLEHSAPPLDLFDRGPVLLKFFAIQSGLLFSMLVVAGVMLLASRPPVNVATRVGARTDDEKWIWALVAVPVVVLCGVVLAAGLTPQKFWGLQTLQFFPLLLACWLGRVRPLSRLTMAATSGVVICLLGGAYLTQESQSPDLKRGIHSMDRVMPAPDLAQSAVADWRGATACPLKYVVGPGFVSGLVSVYSGLYPVVLEQGDFGKSPWVNPQELDRAGALELHGPMPISQIPSEQPYFPVPAPETQGGRAGVFWRVRQPQAC
jgi:hypothetical protein